MKFSTVLSATLLFAGSAFADKVTYDQTYDNPKGSLNSVACSNGVNGLVDRFPTFGDLPSFPFIGGIPTIVFNSTDCGTCWNLAFNGTSINILGIDHSAGFNIALEAMNKLTNNQAVQLGSVNAVATKVAASVCGM